LQYRTFDHPGKFALGLLGNVPPKSIEPIALAVGVSVRTLHAFLSGFRWDYEPAAAMLQHMIAQEHRDDDAIATIEHQ
jgi:hypothetical protein